ncbi:MAG: M48 family metallopeptidase [Pseudomonadota bacterium]
MNFFDAQDNARRVTRRLVVAYALATAMIVAGITLLTGFVLWNLYTVKAGASVEQFFRQQSGIMALTAVLITLLILGASFYKVARLSSGGGKVAVDMGGTPVAPDVRDPLRRRLRNVVEEMAIASGVPVPEIYVLEEEPGINAFAAGYTPGDAAVAVTRGTLELLDRDELQGVIAHEFSHILNGDMRLNIRLMGILFGIMALNLIGRIILRGGHRARGKGAPVVLIIAVGMTVLGWIGMFFARLIKASVSRQREYLADASAVQFTRQTTGIANALKKIGGYDRGSLITATDPEEVAHMLFGAGARLRGAFATHPPLLERIQALDPSFKASDYPRIDARERNTVSETEGPDAGDDRLTRAFAAGGRQYLVEDIADSVGQPDQQHVLYAGGIRRSIPTNLYDAAHSPELAYLLTIALVLDRRGTALPRQIALCQERLGGERSAIIERLYRDLSEIGAEFRLPLLEVSFPALKNRPAPQLAFLEDLCRRLVNIDGSVDLYEFCFSKLLSVNLRQATAPGQSLPRRRTAKREVRAAALELLAILADYSATTREAKALAFAAGIASLPAWAAQQGFAEPGEHAIDKLERGLETLKILDGNGRRMLIRAISAVAMHDKTLSVPEAELIRAVCATLDLPLPPILVHDNP